VVSLALPGRAQVSADAGQDVTVDYPSAAPLDGAVINQSPIDWWTADGNNATEDYLVKFSSASGQSTVGPLHNAGGTHFGFPGDLVRVGGQIYGVDAAARYLYTLDASSGLCTPVSVTPFSSTYTSVFSLAYDATHDKLFAVDLSRKQLLLFSRTTGFPSPIGSGTLAGYPQVRSLAYRASEDRLYAVDQSTSTLIKINPTTGAVTAVVTVAPILNTRIEELEFYGGKLLGSQAILSSGVLVAGQLVEIDMSSGTLGYIGPQLSEVSPHCLLINSLPEEVQWSQVGGPGTASFANSNSPHTTVTFSAPGVYSLELTVFASGGAVSDTVTVTSDGCPSDPNKIVAGVCGCGTPDADEDGDGVLNCLDGCPSDATKTAPGICGCGVSDVDSDGDGTANCLDGCPNDGTKIAPGVCGCGNEETDSDGDGTPNCIDGCPNDPNKISAGVCGCGFADTDTDGDGVANCHDDCPLDANKTSPGVCGCGVADADSDGDGVANCNDGCPLDPSKIAPGACGCGQVDVDSDGDGVADCIDGCPSDANKTSPGACGCGNQETDDDGDGTPNCVDGCPSDPNKSAPGACGCGNPETDDDADGTPNCIDGCPSDANKTSPGVCGCGVSDADSDGDGVVDCLDGCPNDSAKTAPGACGCGAPDVDTDGDGLLDCNDDCPAVFNPAQLDGDLDGIGDDCDNCPLHANPDQHDCDNDGAGDVCEIALGTSTDSNSNGIPDDCEVATGVAYCFGDGSGTACPCSNPGGAGQGCANTTGLGSILANTGGASASADDAVLTVSQLPANKSGILYMGTTWLHAGSGVASGAGLRCVGGQLKRFGVQSSGALGTFTRGGLVAASGGMITSGSTWYFQVWHRDSALACGEQINFSNGFKITFAP
jgi:hypothetical protein